MDQKDLRTIKKGVNYIENQGENWYKILRNGQDFGGKKNRPTLGQIIFNTKRDRGKLNISAERGSH